MKHLSLLLAALLLLLLPACADVSPETTAPSTVAPAETTAPPVIQMPDETVPPTETVPPETEPLTIPIDHDDGLLTFYMGWEGLDLYTYSVAPAGTEDWVRVERTFKSCSDEDYHGFHSPQQFIAQVPDESVTLWRLKGEIIPEELAAMGLDGDAEYSVKYWEDVVLFDGVTYIKWVWSEEAKCHVMKPSALAVCPNCVVEFTPTE